MVESSPGRRSRSLLLLEGEVTMLVDWLIVDNGREREKGIDIYIYSNWPRETASHISCLYLIVGLCSHFPI